MMINFLSLNTAIDAITEAVTGKQELSNGNVIYNNGLGPVTLIGKPEMKENILSFGIDFGIQIISTILLFLAVRFLLWKPITKILEARRDVIEKDYNDAELAKANAIEAEANLKEQYNEAQAKIKEILVNAEREANIRQDEIINSAKAEALRRHESLEQELKQERQNMEAQIKQEIVEIAFQAAEKIVGKEINQDKYLDVVDDILKGVN